MHLNKSSTKWGVFLSKGVCGAVEVKPSINPAKAGDTVTLSLSPATSLNSGSWAVGNVLILTWQGDQQAVFSNHTGRASIDADRALTLNSLTVADSGVYTMKGTEPVLVASVIFTVLEPVSNVTVTTIQTPLLEYSGAAIASCSVSSGSSVSFLWLNGSSEVTANNRVHLTDGNSTLTIFNVTRYDQGPFRCSAINPVSNRTGDSVNFTIYYGPDKMSLTLGSYTVGSNVTVGCSAESNPPAQMQWAFEGKLLNRSGSVLELYNVTKSQSGYYACVAFNNVTNTSNNITGYVQITDATSGSEQPAANLWHLPLLSLAGILFLFFNF